MTTGLEKTSDKALLVIRENLLRGIDLVAEAMDRGEDLDAPISDSGISWRLSGQIKLGMLTTVNAELLSRGIDQKW